MKNMLLFVFAGIPVTGETLEAPQKIPENLMKYHRKRKHHESTYTTR